ncbi:hypothetical protein QCE73_19410 [Caballeronia sp. LZ029]|uniref:hypothetical protein n=1 Tax=Caballeronia sp. LZ029 TaxID=3038564 RepID=UPI00286269BA|nr:hypothetical protein [Caballeronia sp. LZ029]MDR5745330.1 hypothetical protein [Caballeronia sp. LZ029]
MNAQSDFASRKERDLTSEQREQLIRVANIGLQWTAGNITIEDVFHELGRPQSTWHTDGDSYIYDFTDFAASFDWHQDRERQKDGFARVFDIQLAVWIKSNIPREIFDERLKLRRLVPGDVVDGERKVGSPYFIPGGLSIDSDPSLGYFFYRLPLADDSPYDVTAELTYRANYKEQNLEDTMNLRQLNFNRIYLSPKELGQRNLAKRQKYGYMNLRTGMVCPETGWWEGWTAQGHIDKEVVRAGQTFPQANVPRSADAPQGAWFADAQWMWRSPYDEQPGH